MTDDHPSDLLSALPRSRPHRRSSKRPARPESTPAPKPPDVESTPAEKATKAAPRRATRSAQGRPRPAKSAEKKTASKRGTSAKTKPAAARAKRLAQPAQPRGVPQAARNPRPEPSTEVPVLRTAVQAAAELAEIGMTLSAKALRGAIGRLPRP